MQLSGFKNRTGIRAWILSCINLNLTVLSGDVRELLLKCYNCLYITYVVAYLCCNSRHSNQNSRSFRSKIITGRIIFSSPPKSNASKWNSKWRKQRRGKKTPSFQIGNLDCWRLSLSLGIFSTSHIQNRRSVSPITNLYSCSSYLALSALLMTQATPDRAKATENIQDNAIWPLLLPQKQQCHCTWELLRKHC